MSKLLDELKSYLNEMNQYEHVVTLLYWDMKTNTPKLGQAAHIEALKKYGPTPIHRRSFIGNFV